MKKTSKLLALALAGAMMLGLTACGGTAGAGSAANSSAPAASEPAAAAGSAAASDKAYNIGICQLVQHEALDAATKGFKDALTKSWATRSPLMSRTQPATPPPAPPSATSSSPATWT